MNTRKWLLIGAALSLTLAAIGANARPDSDKERQHKKFPINLSELEQRTEARFAKLDSDQNGLLSVTEFEAGPGPRGHHWGQHRGGKDGASRRHKSKHQSKHEDMTASEREELRAKHLAHRAKFEEQLFTAMDTDDNGELSREEASRDKRRAAKHRLHKDRAFKRLDTDQSGSIDPTEFAARLERLRSADANADGKVTRKELRTLHRARLDAEA